MTRDLPPIWRQVWIKLEKVASTDLGLTPIWRQASSLEEIEPLDGSSLDTELVSRPNASRRLLDSF